MKIRIFIISTVLLILAASASAQKTDSVEIKLSEAIELSRGSNGRLNIEKSFNTLSILADKGTARAMNALGLYYLEGKGGVVDTLKGTGWLHAAGDAGYAQGWLNLGLVYKYGRSGMKQNLTLAYQNVEKAANAGNAGGMYLAGYMRYKGLGCQQDYTKAVEFFKSGCQNESVSSMYMLGLCYRNGYGVERDLGNANYWLALSARMGYEFSATELSQEDPENSISTRASLRSNTGVRSPSGYPRIKHLKTLKQNDLNGDYDGVMVTYDWSGKIALKEVPLSLSIKSDGMSFSAEWKEQGMDTLQINGQWQDTCLSFRSAIQLRADHYTGANKVMWSFSDATLQVLNDENASYIIGNLQMYSPETMEPNRPVYLNLKKRSGMISSSLLLPESDRFVVYPNPFSEGVNISFYQSQKSDISIALYATSGECAYTAGLGKYDAGRQNVTLQLPMAAGVYVLKLTTGDKVFQSIVIRK